jgi:hypothetical protein
MSFFVWMLHSSFLFCGDVWGHDKQRVMPWAEEVMVSIARGGNGQMRFVSNNDAMRIMLGRRIKFI